MTNSIITPGDMTINLSDTLISLIAASYYMRPLAWDAAEKLQAAGCQTRVYGEPGKDGEWRVGLWRGNEEAKDGR